VNIGIFLQATKQAQGNLLFEEKLRLETRGLAADKRRFTRVKADVGKAEQVIIGEVRVVLVWDEFGCG
jgi:hypothetical protein